MKILKKGTPATAVISCPHCKCEMEYTNMDIHETYIDYTNQSSINMWPSNKEVIFYIKCPCCGEHIIVRKL